MIRVTVQIEDGQDESDATVISASFDNVDEVINSDFLNKARLFEEKKKPMGSSNKKPMGFETGKE